MEEESPEVKLLKLMTSAYSSIIVIEELGTELDKNSEITIQKFFQK
jgi:hypothetical protein